jgi:hypothetical protein
MWRHWKGNHATNKYNQCDGIGTNADASIIDNDRDWEERSALHQHQS